MLAILAGLIVAAWAFGAFDRLFYLFQVETARTSAVEQLEVPDAEQSGRYVYAQLSDEDREKYLILLDAFQSREERAYPETDMDELARMRDCVLADHPELFYISGVQMQTLSNRGSGIVTGVTVEGQYSFSEGEVAALQPQIDDAVAACLAGLPEGADDYGKAKYLYEYLAATVEYDRGAAAGGVGVLGATSGQTIAETLVGHSAVCAGYARTYQYLLNQLGIPCVYVTGTAHGNGHAWCAAYLDGNWYFVDPTWGDPQFLDEGGEAVDFGGINYDYLCVTSDDIATTHTVDCPYELPACTSVADNYFVREGLYVTDSDVEWAGSLIQAAAERGESFARFRCDTRATYDQVTYTLFDNREIYRFIPGTSCRYLLGDALCTVEVSFE